MISIYEFDQLRPEEILNRDIRAEAGVQAAVEEIIGGVRARGDQALREYERRFDGAVLDALEVSEEEMESACRRVDPEFWKTLEMAADNIRDFHRRQIHQDFVVSERGGVVMGQRYTPIEKVGVCAPGTPVAFPSTILMNVIPARLAGVREIVIATAPEADGSISAEALAAARIAGATRVFRIGGAQAVAAMAFGTESVPKVDKIVGPGGVYVATAKRLVFGLVDIDMIAGPSEILVLADGTCNPKYVAADLLSQAEHDKLASAVLVTDSRPLARAVQLEIEAQLDSLSRGEVARESIARNGKILMVRDLDEAVEAVNLIAPEHLELCVDDPFRLLGSIRNAGSIFLGKYAPEALGDYFAGPNHTLPTSGTARFSSPLSVDDFVKKSSFLYYSKEALEQAHRRVADFARREGLDAHARSVAIRFEREEEERV
ncbi:histidinol dehydrogenase [Oscillibacter sp. MSJ-2]|uniref:Histidinol dehydrogenase n=1 Tax=Dysosmobacter acutus TaxID=2841504 RepID=A0ABS6FB48_9FIRM|nr:histidinol dehydrogenase [Dysosmobacter acutus]